MDDAERLRLWHGPYRPPRYGVGGRLVCAVRGFVEVVGTSHAPIPWPQARNHGRPFLIVCGGLARAVRTEAAIAVAHWWGVTPLTVWTWRKALGVGATTPGTSRLRRAHALGPAGTAALAKAQAKARDPGRRAKIAAARRGKPRPRHVIEAMRAANLRRKHTDQTRRRMSEAHRQRGTRPPAAGRPWTAEEDALLRAGLPAAEVAGQTERTLTAVYKRRGQLGLPDGRRKGQG
jgi:hypothetical protein